MLQFNYRIINLLEKCFFHKSGARKVYGTDAFIDYPTIKYDLLKGGFEVEGSLREPYKEGGVEALLLASDAVPEKVKSNAGFNLDIKSDPKRLEDFTNEEIELLRKLDVYGIAHR